MRHLPVQTDSAMKPLSAPGGRKIRTACNVCHKAKMRCSGGNPCASCERAGCQCRYSISNRLGRPPKSSANVKVVSGINDATIPLASAAGSLEDMLTLDDMFIPTSRSSEQSLRHTESTSTGSTHENATSERVHLPSQSSMTMDMYNTPPQSTPSSVCSNAISPCDTQKRDDAPRCHCLQQQNQFMWDLEKLDRTYDSSVIAITLDAARHGLELWQELLRCQSCRFDEENGAILLSIMSTGTVVKRLWHILVNEEQQSACPDGLPQGGVPLGLNTRATQQGARPNIDEVQIPEDERMYVIGMLVLRTLRRINDGSENLRRRIELGGQSGSHVRCNYHPLKNVASLMLDTLDESVQDLTQAFQSTTML
ncbi:hypothetical protein BJ170DRAFT_635034 [Xylariales sp. AK1849]|nr:hypothetical protein BJ170DRAFT_635034 [Xylariales sp. AK1849]